MDVGVKSFHSKLFWLKGQEMNKTKEERMDIHNFKEEKFSFISCWEGIKFRWLDWLSVWFSFSMMEGTKENSSFAES